MYWAILAEDRRTIPARIFDGVLTGELHEAGEVVQVVDRLCLEELRSRLHLLLELDQLRLQRLGLRRDDRPRAELDGPFDIVASQVLARLQRADGMQELKRVEIEDSGGLLMVTHWDGVAGQAEDVLHAAAVGEQ